MDSTISLDISLGAGLPGIRAVEISLELKGLLELLCVTISAKPDIVHQACNEEEMLW